MLAALSVLGGFAWFCVPFKVPGRTEVARKAAARADVRHLRLALDTFKLDACRYPGAAEGLGALVDRPSDLINWHGPYVGTRIVMDLWGQRYVYIPSTESSPPRVVSLGPDGKQGTADDIGSR